MKTIFVSLFIIFTATAAAQNPKIKPGIVTKITINPEKMNPLTNDYTQFKRN